MNKTDFFKTFLVLLAVCMLAVVIPFQACLASDDIQTYTITAPILTDDDDMEELKSNGSLHFESTHLELGCEHPGNADDNDAQLVYLRFDNLQVPAGAQIINAYIQFTVYGSNSSPDPFSLTIAAEDSANAAPMPEETEDNTAYAISSRLTIGAILWQSNDENPLRWHTENRAGEDQQTPDLSVLVQQIIDKPDWQYGNAISFIIQGDGNRVAYSHNKSADKAPMLCVTYSTPVLLQSAPEGLTATTPTSTDDYDGSIVGTTPDMEYMVTGSDTWQPCKDGAVTGLHAGEYLVRYAQKPGYAASEPATVSVLEYVLDVTLQPGANETEMNFNWYCKHRSENQTILQVAPKADMTGDAFPADTAQTFYGEHCNSSGYMANWATATGLQPDTEYVYRFSTGYSYSQVYHFSTRHTDTYNFIFVGDPQIGSSGARNRDSRGWNATLEMALSTFPDTSFILCAGDQVESEYKEEQYESFFAPEILTSVPYAPTIGNHDVWYSYADHFNTPNESETYGKSMAGNDYWFTYGKTLFIDLNTNAFDIEDHDAFIGEAIAAAGDDIIWKILVFHHSVYSSGSHSQEPIILSWRKYLVPMIDKYDIDVALSGHDHCYTRTYQMLGGVAQTGDETTVINPIGTVYVTMATSSGSQFYDLHKGDMDYCAVRWQEYEAIYANVEVTDTSFSITVYKSADNTIIDQYTIIKDDTLVPVNNVL